VVHTRFSIAGEVIWKHKKHQNSWRRRQRPDWESLQHSHAYSWCAGRSLPIPNTHPTVSASGFKPQSSQLLTHSLTSQLR